MRLTKQDAAALKAKGFDIGEEKPRKVNPYAPYRSKWEADYAAELPRLMGTEYSWMYERVSFCLVPPSATQKGVWYIPDFTIWKDGELGAVHEIKGFWRAGAKHKVKALAALLRPLPVIVLRKSKTGGWDIERF